MNHFRSRTIPLLVALVALCIGGCQSDNPNDAEQTLTVLAASSLTEAFTEIAAEFETSRPGVDISISFGSSSTLATQVTDGAAADVLATASPGSMQPVVDAGEAKGEPDVFAINTVAVALPQRNPADIGSLADLESRNVTVAVCVETAPCGSVAEDMFATAELDVTPATLEVDVKSVLAKVVADEVDAGVVYASDIVAAGDTVTSLPVPKESLVSTDYLITPLTSTSNSQLADDFVALVQSSEGQSVLAASGFDNP